MLKLADPRTSRTTGALAAYRPAAIKSEAASTLTARRMNTRRKLAGASDIRACVR
jgi:hypothetical protein